LGREADKGSPIPKRFDNSGLQKKQKKGGNKNQKQKKNPQGGGNIHTRARFKKIINVLLTRLRIEDIARWGN
jgi:hypothetical protein